MNPEPYEEGPAGDPIEAQARRWVALRDQGIKKIQRAELERWLAEDPSHRKAFKEADAKRTDVEWALHAGAVDEVLEGLQKRSHHRKRRRLVSAGVTAALVLFAVSFWQTGRPAASPVRESTHLTIIEPKQIALPDGSTVQLRDDTQVAFKIVNGQRRVELTGGSAYFKVAHDKTHPFIVSSRGIEVRAVGTAFTVESGKVETEILVTEGTVAVTRRAEDRPLTKDVFAAAGTRVVVENGSSSEPSTPHPISDAELHERLAWHLPRLEFVGTPLSEVVAVMNKHNRIRIVIAEAPLGSLQLSGAVRADKIEAILEMVRTDFSIYAERRDGEIILRRTR